MKNRAVLFLFFFLLVGASGWAALPHFDVREYGAVGDGTTKDTTAIQAAIDAATAAGGGVVYLGPGTYLSGSLRMKDHVTLHLEAGATLLGSTDIEDYPCVEPAFRSYTDKYVCQSLIAGEGLKNIAITGRGTIDGQGAAFDSDTPDHGYRKRPYIIRLVSCRDVLVEGITLRDSPMWMQHYLDCDNLTLRGLTVYNHVNRNNDMINVDCCRNVRISDCLGTSGDDAITLKSTADKPCENVVVTNCTVSSNCNAIKMGTETNGGFKNVTVTNCTVSRPVNGYFGNRSLSGIALMIVDGGTMEGVTISNIAMEGVKSAIFIRLGNRARPFKEGMERPGVGALRNVTISNIEARNVENTGCFVAGLPGFPVENVTIGNARITFAGGGTKVDDMWAVPENADQYPEGTMFGMLPAYGFYCRHVRGLTFTNVQVAYDAPDPRPALVCDDVQNLVLDSFRGESQPESAALMVMKDTQNALIRGSVAPKGCPAFLRLETGCSEIVAVGNDLKRAESPFTFADGVDQTILHAQANRLE